MIEVHARYSFDGSFYRDDAAYHAAGRVSDFSGHGLGERDLGWVCKSEFEAEKLRRALEKIGLRTTVSPADTKAIENAGACQSFRDADLSGKIER